MSFVSKFFNAIREQEKIYRNKYHESIKKNIDYDLIAYYGQRYEMARDLQRVITSPYDYQTITDMFEEIASKISENNYRDLQIKKCIQEWTIEDTPRKYKELSVRNARKGWISLVPKEYEGEIDARLLKCSNFIKFIEKTENPYGSDSIVYIIEIF